MTLRARCVPLRPMTLAMTLAPLAQWRCDACGRLIGNANEGVVQFHYVNDAPVERREVDFRIVHGGNAEDGSCITRRSGLGLGDMPLRDLVGERAILKMLGHQSTDPTWAEVFRRVCVPYYEEARHLFDKARMGGWEVIPEKLSVEKLMGIINAFTR